MKKKSLFETNPYLKSPEKYRNALIINVSSSTAVETGASVASIARMLAKSATTGQLTEKKKSTSQ